MEHPPDSFLNLSPPELDVLPDFLICPRANPSFSLAILDKYWADFDKKGPKPGISIPFLQFPLLESQQNFPAFLRCLLQSGIHDPVARYASRLTIIGLEDQITLANLPKSSSKS